MARLSALACGALLACVLAGALGQAAHAEPAWTTYHRDAGRSGNDPDATEPIVPVKAWQSPDLGAPIWQQPLILGSQAYIATVGDKIYALNASTGAVVWEKSAGVPVPSGELPCGDITPTVGIVGTPVIDTSKQVIYAVADTWNASTKEAHHVLKGYSLSGGEEVLSTAVDPPGADPKALLQRTALNLDAGMVVFGMGGNDGDCGEYRGTVVGAPENGGSPLYWRYQPASPSKSGGAVWGTSGPAVDSEGHIYASTGNPNPPGGQKAETYDYSDSVVELSSSLSQIGNFEPSSWLQDSNSDADLGSAGPELLPGGLLFQAGKNRIGYLIDESKLGEGAPAVFSQQVCGGGGSFGGDAFANSTIYVPCTDGVRALTYNQTARTFTALWQGPSDANGPPIVSAGLVWSVATAGGGGTKLYGIDPATGKPRYTETLPSGVADHFASSSAAGGRLFVASGSSVTAYQIAKTLTSCTPEGFCTSFIPENIEGSFKEPNGVAIDPSGNIFVADPGHYRVLEFNKERKYLRQFGSTGTGNGQFTGIQGIATDASGDVYVSDSSARVQEFSPSGAFLRQFGSPGSGNGQFYYPTAIAVDSGGNVWVLDTLNYRVQKFSATGAYLSQFGSKGSGNGQLGWAFGLAFSGGNLYVSDSQNQRVQEFSTSGTYLAQFGSGGTGNGQFRYPRGIASDPATGNLYVSDSANNRVQEFSAAGSFIAAFGSAGSGPGQFSSPTGVAVNASGNLYVADTGNNRVQEWSAGNPPTYATSFIPENIEGSFKEPNGVAIDPSGNIWVADPGHYRVLEFNSKREYLRQFGSTGTGNGQFTGIQGIATDASGDVYVSDSSARVQEFSPSGAFLRQFGSPGSGNGQFYYPTAIAVDSGGNVWVLDTLNYRVQKFSATGAYLSQFGSKGSGNGQLGWAFGLAFSGGNLYVSDSQNQRVQEFSTSGTYLAQFGSGGTGNGQFRYPRGIASDPSSGNLYVSDTANNRIEEFSSAGSFIAAFGSGGSGAGQLSSPSAVAVNASGRFFVADTGNNRIEEWLTSP